MVEQSCVHTPGLKALAETVCTERCIAFNGGTPHFFFSFFLLLLNGTCTQSEMTGHKTNMPDKRQQRLDTSGYLESVRLRFFEQQGSTTALLAVEVMKVPQRGG